jgi:hypothetical protein
MKKKKKEISQTENFDFMKTNKDNIENILWNTKETLPTIDDLVIRTNKIVIHAYQYIKLRFTHLYKKKKDFPTIDKEYICDVFKVLTKRKCNSGGYTEESMPKQLDVLTKFYNRSISKLCDNLKSS